jgi:demethylmenaquinone methyltransferase/2-methoxy-6-polyprenyl-1,4-benzoquinol methylase
MAHRERDSYRLLGLGYDTFCRIYAGRRIAHCRSAFIDRIRPGERALFAGVGHGAEAIAAAELGAAVTAVDSSATMLRRLRALAAARPAPPPIEVRHLDVRSITERDGFDWVFANFFLNVFYRAEMEAMLRHLARLVRVGGHLVIGDFCPPSGALLRRCLQQTHWYLALAPFALCTRNAIHPIYDYAAYLPDACLKLIDARRFGACGIDLFASLLTKRYALDPTTVVQGPDR